ncbi:MAG: hypothetical protein ACP5IX_02540, partial [Patescibacteria group bacterium]
INSYPNRAHNDFLDTLLVSGLFGLIFYLWLIVSIFYCGLKYIFKIFNHQIPISKQILNSRFMVLALLTGLTGYLISLQFSFHVIQTAVYFWLYLGLVCILTTSDKFETNGQIKFNFKKLSLVILLIIVTGVFIWQFSLKMLVADWYYKKAILAFRRQRIEEEIENYAKAIDFQPEEAHYRERLAADLFNLAISISDQKQEEKIKMLNLAVEVINDIPTSRRNVEANANLARILTLKAKVSQKPEDFQLAEQSVQSLVDFSPYWATLYNDWCQLKIYQKNWDQALEKCQKALSLYPDLNHPDLNFLHRQQIIVEMIQVYEKLGQIYFEKKDDNKSLENYWQVLRLSPFQYHLYKKIADIYYLRRDLDRAIFYNSHGYILNPHDYAWPWAIALLYQEKGNLEMAKKYAQKALELSPENEQIKKFLEKLK